MEATRAKAAKTATGKRRAAAAVLAILKKSLHGTTYLEKERRHKHSVFRTLIATILSARNRDENTGYATHNLFSAYRTPKEIAHAPLKKIEKLVRKSGFFRSKARYVKETSRIVEEELGGKVPSTMAGLLKLPGVGRKVAGCVMVYGFGKPALPVDTHVHRISNLLGLVRTKRPEETEKELMMIVPRRKWIKVNELFVVFGQSICKPVGPKCWLCPVFGYCKWPGRLKRKKIALKIGKSD